MSYLIDYEEIDRGYVAFGGNPKGRKITRKSTIETGKAAQSLLKKVDEDPRKESKCKDQEKEDNVNNTNNVNTVSSTINVAGTNEENELPFDPNLPVLEDVSIFNFSSDDEDDDTVTDMNNLDRTIQVSPIPTTRIHKDYPLDQKKDDIFISQDKYVAKILKKFRFTEIKTTSTPMETQKPLLKDKDDEEVDVHKYRYQVNLKFSHLHAMKRNFRYLKGQPKLGFWYPKNSLFDLVAYTDSDYAGASLNRKSKTGGCQFLGCRLISWQYKKQAVVVISTTEAKYRLLSATITLSNKAEDPILIVFNKWYQSLVRSFDQQKNNIQAQQKKKMMKKSSSSENKPCCSKACKKNTDNLNSKITELSEKLNDKELELIKKEKEGVDGKLEGFLTASNDLDNLIEDDTITDYSRPSPTIESTSDDAQNKNPSVTKTGASDSTILSKPFIKFVKATDCTEVKTNKVEAIRKSSVKYAEIYRITTKKTNVRGNQRNWNNLKSHELGPNFIMKKKTCYNCGSIDHLAYDYGLGVKNGRTCPILGKGLFGKVIPLFQTMVIQNQSELGEGSAMPTNPHHTPTILQPSSSQPQKIQKPRKPKRKDTHVPQPSGPTINVADEPVHMVLGDTLVRAATSASSLEAEQDSGNTLLRDEDSMKLDELMALCTTLQNRVLDLEKTKATQKIEINSLKGRVKKLEKRNRLRTHKLKRLYKAGMSARVEYSNDEESLGEDASKQERRIDVIDADEDITLVNDVDNEMFDVDDLGIMIEEPVKPKKKDQIRLDEEAALKLQVEFDEEERLARERAEKEQEANISLIETWADIQAKIDADHHIPDEEEVATDAIPLAVKSPRIVDWKIHKEGKKSYYQIVRADGKSQMYMIFSQMLQSFNREDLEYLYKLVKARYGSTRPVENIDYLLWSDMKTMFEPHIEDEIWKMQQGYKVLELKLYDSCGVHSLMMQSMQIYMLVEKKYPLTPPTLLMMLEKKLQFDYESKMAY
uniref:Uncharacterized protein n=1 Tax=Tanacetum cinerariifolium TaxID=118510 RepID=A0A6L2KGH5_TANCI|nr:hypothetical protein [Tanacetum cinerariifolium]